MKEISSVCPIHGHTTFEATGVNVRENEALVQCRCLQCSHPRTVVLTIKEYESWATRNNGDSQMVGSQSSVNVRNAVKLLPIL